MRAQMGAAPIETVKLGDSLAMLSGPGGNVVVLSGPDGKIVVDTFVQPAWAVLKQTLDTKKRLSEMHDLFGMHFVPAPAGVLPTETFTDNHDEV